MRRQATNADVRKGMIPMRSKKVAYVATVYAHLAAFHLPFMKDLQAQGFDVHAYASPDQRKEALIAKGLECRDISFSRNPLAFGNIQAIRALTERFKAEDYDLIHVHTPNASVVCRIAAWLAGSRQVVYTAHGFHFFRGASRANWRPHYPIERFMARFTDVLVTINKEDYEIGREISGSGRNRLIFPASALRLLLSSGRTMLSDRGNFAPSSNYPGRLDRAGAWWRRNEPQQEPGATAA